MKILIVSDIHQDEQSVEKIKGKMDSGDFDYLFVCGDIAKSVSFTEEFIEKFKDAFIIPGNWETEEVNDALKKAKNYINEKKCGLSDGLNVVGFGYSNITPFNTFGELHEEDILDRMSKLNIDNNTILLLHCPPKGFFDEINNEFVGSESILKIIEEKKPALAVFGHVHEHYGVTMLEQTKLIKVPAAVDMKCAELTIKNKEVTVEFVML
jgi:Icc-related predicted phosphoesterase